jgi:hypothetical protein
MAGPYVGSARPPEVCESCATSFSWRAASASVVTTARRRTRRRRRSGWSSASSARSAGSTRRTKSKSNDGSCAGVLHEGSSRWFPRGFVTQVQQNHCVEPSCERMRRTIAENDRGEPLWCRPVAQLVEYRSPKPGVGGSSPSWPANDQAPGARPQAPAGIRYQDAGISLSPVA